MLGTKPFFSLAKTPFKTVSPKPNFNDVKFLCSECYQSKYVEENSNKVLNYAEVDNICEECKKEDENVKSNLIMFGFKVCNSCKTSKTIFPI